MNEFELLRYLFEEYLTIKDDTKNTVKLGYLMAIKDIIDFIDFDCN